MKAQLQEKKSTENNKPKRSYKRKPGSNPPGNPKAREIISIKPKYELAKEMQKRCDLYFNECKKEKRPLTITGLALALGFLSRQSLLNYENAENHSKTIEADERKLIVDTIKKAKLRIEQYAEENLYTGRQVAGTIFNLKNNYNWIDRQDFQHGGDVIVNFHGLSKPIGPNKDKIREEQAKE